MSSCMYWISSMLLFLACVVLGRLGRYDTTASNREVKAGSLIMNWGSRCAPLEARKDNFCAVKGVEMWRFKYSPFWNP